MLFAASLVLYLLSKLRPKSDSFPQLPTRTGLARRAELIWFIDLLIGRHPYNSLICKIAIDAT
jgi:hypothetical protein